MANSAQARKRARQSERNRLHNASLRSRMRTHLKKVVRAVDAKDAETAANAYREAIPMLDSLVGKGLVPKNTAARKKSRLNARIKALASAA